MEINNNLVQRAQMLLTLEHPLSQVREILLREGYPGEQVTELIEATEEVLNYLIPPEYDENKIGIDILLPGEKAEGRKPTVDILVDKRTGKLSLITPGQQETWKVANEIRKALKIQKYNLQKHFH
ncbi:MAG: hypothetical protein PHZ11_02430 [Desulfitobacteriaceae bacterium]|nr:hypothetical protein [Desulfitobacteriaceae bacterium]MDD4345752.1 hypothetical protein [Desulfitobacteriaceae bacterium]MDD4400957.1 hypothetical protein [Desulfitobacteriaceae bacterium]